MNKEILKNETVKKLCENHLRDLLKKDVDVFERANIIDHLLLEFNCSQRQLANKLGMSHSTLADHYRYKKLNKTQFDLMQKKGFNKTHIYRQLRNNTEQEAREIVEKELIDNDLDSFIIRVRLAIREKKSSSQTVNLVKTLQNELNRLLMYIEK